MPSTACLGRPTIAGLPNKPAKVGLTAPPNKAWAYKSASFSSVVYLAPIVYLKVSETWTVILPKIAAVSSDHIMSWAIWSPASVVAKKPPTPGRAAWSPWSAANCAGEAAPAAAKAPNCWAWVLSCVNHVPQTGEKSGPTSIAALFG